jgi:hypothetical protein
MMTISLHQPWASALFVPDETSWHAVKHHETRGRRMPKHYEKQWVGLHAAKNKAVHTRRAWAKLVEGEPQTRARFADEGFMSFDELPFGCVIGRIMFGPSVPSGLISNADEVTLRWGDYSTGRWAWPVLQFELFEMPIPALGRQGWFDVDLTAAIAADHGSNVP